MPSLLFIDHSYHEKTSSSIFIQQLLGTQYDVTVFSFDPYKDDIDIYRELKQKPLMSSFFGKFCPKTDI